MAVVLLLKDPSLLALMMVLLACLLALVLLLALPEALPLDQDQMALLF